LKLASVEDDISWLVYMIKDGGELGELGLCKPLSLGLKVGIA
jgi:hypothetical protein